MDTDVITLRFTTPRPESMPHSERPGSRSVTDIENPAAVVVDVRKAYGDLMARTSCPAGSGSGCRSRAR
jgi:hypothetical protein